MKKNIFFVASIFLVIFNQNFSSDAREVLIQPSRQLQKFFPQELRYKQALNFLDNFVLLVDSVDYRHEIWPPYVTNIKKHLDLLETFLKNNKKKIKKILVDPFPLPSFNEQPTIISMREQNFEGCPYQFPFALPSTKTLQTVLGSRGYSDEQVEKDLAWNIYDSNTLCIRLALMQQNQSYCVWKRGQKTIFQLVNQIKAISRPIEYFRLPSNKVLQSVLFFYIAKMQLINSETDLLVQSWMNEKDRSIIKKDDLDKALSELRYSDFFGTHEIVIDILSKSTPIK